MKNYFISARPFFNGKPVRLEEMDGEMKAYVGDILKALGINDRVENVLKDIPKEDISKKGDKRKKSYISPEHIRKIMNRTSSSDEFGEWFANVLRQLEEGEVLETEGEEKKMPKEDSYSTDLLEELLRRQNLILENQLQVRKDISEIKDGIGTIAEGLGKIVADNYLRRKDIPNAPVQNDFAETMTHILNGMRGDK